MSSEFDGLMRQYQTNLAASQGSAQVADKPWTNDAYEVGRQAAAGFAVDLPRMVGQGARWLGVDGGGLDDWGRSVVEAADARAPGWEADTQGRGAIAKTLAMGSRALAPMAGAVGAAFLPGGQVLAPAMAAATFGPSAAQDTYDKIRNAGGSVEEANAAGWRVGTVQGGGEAIGGALLRPAMALGRAAIGAAGASTGSVAARMTDTAFLKPLAKGMGLNLLVQPATEVAQDVSTEFIERSYGAAPEDAWQIAKDSAQGAVGLTALLGPLAVLGHRRRSQQAGRLNEALNSPFASDEVRAQARDMVVDRARENGATDGDAWLDKQYAADDATAAGRERDQQDQIARGLQRRDIDEIRALMRGNIGEVDPDPTADSQGADVVSAAVQANLSSQQQAQQQAAAKQQQEQAPLTPEQERIQAIKTRAAEVAKRNAEVGARAESEFGITKPAAQITYGDLEQAHNEGLINDDQLGDMAGQLSGKALGLGTVRKELSLLRKNRETANELQVQRAQAQQDEMAKLQANMQANMQASTQASTQANTRVEAPPTSKVETQAAEEKTPGQKAVEELEVELGKTFTPIAKRRLFTRLGFDLEGNPTGLGMRTLDEVAAIEAARTGKKAVSRQAIEKTLSGYGLTDAAVEKLGRRLEGSESATDTGLAQELTGKSEVRTAQDGTEELVTPQAAEVTTPTISDGLDITENEAASAMGDAGNDGQNGGMTVRTDLGSRIANTGNEDATAHSKTVMAVADQLARSEDFSSLPEGIRTLVEGLSPYRDRVLRGATLDPKVNAHMERIGDKLASALVEAGRTDLAEMVAPGRTQEKVRRTRDAVAEQIDAEDAARQAKQAGINAARIAENAQAALRHPEAKNAQADWESTIAWNDLSDMHKADWIYLYVENLENNGGNINFQELGREQGRIEDESRKQTPSRANEGDATGARPAQLVGGQPNGPTVQERNAQGSALQEDPGAVEDLVVGKPTGQEVVKVKKKRVAVMPGAQLSVVEQDRVDSGKPPVGSTVAQVQAEVDKLMPTSSRKLVVVNKLSDLPADVQAAVTQSLRDGGGSVQGLVFEGRAYLVADNIAPGKARSVFMHEVGSHLGLENLLTKAQMKTLVDQIREWQTRDDSSVEFQLAQRAQDRLDAANTSAENADSELLAYFVEEATDAGIDPTAMSYKGELNRWFRTLWAAFKSAIRKLNLARVDQLNAQDVIDLAYGAARLEMAGTFHGTAAQFRKFNHNFMNSGEGAQAFGWGSYLAQRAGIAKGYWGQDVERKTEPGGVSIQLDGKDIIGDLGRRNWLEYADELEARGFRFDESEKRSLSAFMARLTDKFDGDVKAYEENKLDDRLYHNNPIGVQRLLNRFSTTDVPGKVPDGALMRIDTIIPESEMLDWDKKLSGFALKALQEKLPQELREQLEGAANLDLDEMTGEQFYRYLEELEGVDGIVSEQFDAKDYNSRSVNAKPDKIVSTYLDEVVGIGGIRFLDARSRGKSGTLVFKGQRFTGEDFRIKTAEVQKLGDKAALLRVVLQKGPQDAISDLEGVVKKYEGMFYQVAQESAERFGTEFNEKQARGDAAKEAAALEHGVNLQWLKDNADSITIDTNGVTRNIVIFNDKNIQRVSSAIGADREAAKFSQAAPLPSAPKASQVQRAIAQLPFKARGPVRNSLATIGDWVNKGLDRIVFTGELIERAEKQGMSEARKLADLLGARAVKARELERQIEKIADMYVLVPESDRGDGPHSVGRFLFDSTREGKWGYGEEADADMADRFDALKPESQALVRAVFEHGNEMLAQKKAMVLEFTNSEYDGQIAALKNDSQANPENAQENAKDITKLQRAKVADMAKFKTLFALREGRPYAPIKRFGTYAVIAKSPEYQAAYDAGDQTLLRKLEQDADHYHVSFVESKNEGRNLRDRLVASGFFGQDSSNIELVERDKFESDLYGGASMLTALTQLRSRVDAEAGGGGKGAQQMRSMVSELYLHALAEGSARKSEMRRRNVAGEVDMLRSFTMQGRADAVFLASVVANPQVQDALRALRGQSRRGGDTTRKSELYNEIMARYVQSLEVDHSPLINKITRMSSVWFLASSPNYYIQNLTQPWMMSVPAMGAKFGYGRASAAQWKAYSELGALMKSARLFDQQFDFSQVPNDGRLKEAVNELVNRGSIDIGMQTELGEFRIEGEGAAKERWNKIDKGMRIAVQKVESINRLSTAMAAYRLYMDAHPGKHDAAVDYAQRILSETHGNYDRFSAPRMFNNKFGKVALQFRKFQLIQLTFYGKLIRDAYEGNDRAVALKTLAYSLAHTGTMAGIMGLPGFAAISWLLGAMAGDDDGKFDLADSMRSAMKDVGVSEEIATMLMRGAPAFAGADLSGKVGAGTMLSIMPFSRADLSTDQGKAEAVGGFLGGASLGMATRILGGFSLMASGEWYKGIERTLPKGISDVLAAYRIANDGLTRPNGDVIMPAEDVSEVATFIKAIGFQPTDQSVLYERRNRAYDTETHFKDRSTRVKNEYVKAVKASDPAGRAAATEAWMKLQKARVEKGYKAQPLSTLLKAPQEQAKRERETMEGVGSNRNNQAYVESMTSR